MSPIQIFLGDVDLVVIGSGPGGYVAAIKAAQLGMNVSFDLKTLLKLGHGHAGPTSITSLLKCKRFSLVKYTVKYVGTVSILVIFCIFILMFVLMCSYTMCTWLL